jgi:hypothetical protein
MFFLVGKDQKPQLVLSVVVVVVCLCVCVAYIVVVTIDLFVRDSYCFNTIDTTSIFRVEKCTRKQSSLSIGRLFFFKKIIVFLLKFFFCFEFNQQNCCCLGWRRIDIDHFTTDRYQSHCKHNSQQQQQQQQQQQHYNLITFDKYVGCASQSE